MSDSGADLGPAPKGLEGLGFRFGFFKLIVLDMAAMIDFYARAFGFVEAGARVDLPEVEEAMLTLPGATFTLVLLRWKDGRDIEIGSAYGPVGFKTRNLEAAFAHLEQCGATPLRKPFALGPMRIAFAADPEGHELELIEHVRS